MFFINLKYILIKLTSFLLSTKKVSWLVVLLLVVLMLMTVIVFFFENAFFQVDVYCLLYLFYIASIYFKKKIAYQIFSHIVFLFLNSGY